MNFFERQAAARRTSSRLVVLFALAVAGIVFAIDAAAFLAYGAGADAEPGEIGALLVFTTLLTLGVIGLGSLYRVASLRGGGEPVALQLGGTPIAADTTDFNLRRLRNVVEEIAIASGVPVPKIYVLEHEAAINAFAAGYSPSDAVIAVTRGALDRLNRDELQGVIAHEFSHILNGDMRLNIRLMGVLFGILMIGLIGRKILQHGRFGGRNKGAGAILVAALIAMVVGYVGLFFGRMIKAGVSRQREQLADASAVQFTRQTTGLAGALKKIGGIEEGSRLNERDDAEEVSHMLFGDGVGFSGLFATHPPLIERIQALEPQFRPNDLEALQNKWIANPPNGLEEDAHLGLVAKTHARLPAEGASFAVTPPMIVAQVARPAADDYRRADAIADRIPDALRVLAGRRDMVMPLLLGLLLDDDARLQSLQREEIAARMGLGLAQHAAELRREHLAGAASRAAPAARVDRLPRAALAAAAGARRVPRYRARHRAHRWPRVAVRILPRPPAAGAGARIARSDAARALRPQQAVERAQRGRDAAVRRRAVRATTSAESRAACVPRRHPARAAAATTCRTCRARNGALALDPVWAPLDALDPLAKQSVVEGLVATSATTAP